MDSLNIYEYDDVGTAVKLFPERTVTSPSLDEGSSPYGHGIFDSPFTPSPALQKHHSWRAPSTSPRPLPVSSSGGIETRELTPFRGHLFASSPSPTRPAPASPSAQPRDAETGYNHSARIAAEPVRSTSCSRTPQREGTAAYQRDPSLSPLAPQMASDTSSGEDCGTDDASDTVVSFSTTDEDAEEDTSPLAHPSVPVAGAKSTVTPSPGTRGSAPAGLPPMAPVAAGHPYDVPSPSRERSFSPSPPCPGEQVERTLHFAQQERVRSRSPERVVTQPSQKVFDRERSPSPRAVGDDGAPGGHSETVTDGPRRSHARRATRPGKSLSSVSLSPLSSPSQEPCVVGVVEYSSSDSSPVPPAQPHPHPVRQRARFSPPQHHGPEARTPVREPDVVGSFCSPSPHQRDARSPQNVPHRDSRHSASPSPDRPAQRVPLCRATIEILPGQSHTVDLFDGDDAESCARAFVSTHGLREAVALGPLVSFFSEQLQRYAKPTRREPSPTVPQLRYGRADSWPSSLPATNSSVRSFPSGSAGQTVSDTRSQQVGHRTAGTPHLQSSPALQRGRAVSARGVPHQFPRDDVTLRPVAAPRARAALTHRRQLPTAGQKATSEMRSGTSPEEAVAPHSARPWNTSTRLSAGQADGAAAQNPWSHETRLASPRQGVRRSLSEHSTSSRASSWDSRAGRPLTAQTRGRRTNSPPGAAGMSILEPRPTRASLLRAQATRAASAERPQEPPVAQRSSRSTIRTAPEPHTHKPQTAPGTQRLCRARSAPLARRSRSLSADSIAATQSSASAVNSTATTRTPRYARTTQSASQRQSRHTATPRSGKSEADVPGRHRLNLPRPVAATKKRVSFAEEYPTRGSLHSAPSKAAPPAPVEPAASRSSYVPPNVSPPVKAAPRGQRSLFAHVDPNQLAPRKSVLHTPTAKRPPPVKPHVSAPLDSEAEIAAIAEKARRWFTALGHSTITRAEDASPASPDRDDRARDHGAGPSTSASPAASTAGHLLPRSRFLETLRHVGSTPRTQPSVSQRSASVDLHHPRPHSQLWQDMGIDSVLRSRTLNNSVSAQEGRPFYQPYIGR